MTPKAMRKMGITFLVIGIVSYILSILCWMSFGISMFSGNTDFIFLPFILFALFVILTYFAYGAIPLLIISSIKLRREKAEQEQINLYGYCTQCGTPKTKDAVFCSKCGNRLA